MHLGQNDIGIFGGRIIQVVREYHTEIQFLECFDICIDIRVRHDGVG